MGGQQHFRQSNDTVSSRQQAAIPICERAASNQDRQVRAGRNNADNQDTKVSSRQQAATPKIERATTMQTIKRTGKAADNRLQYQSTNGQQQCRQSKDQGKQPATGCNTRMASGQQQIKTDDQMTRIAADNRQQYQNGRAATFQTIK